MILNAATYIKQRVVDDATEDGNTTLQPHPLHLDPLALR